MTQEAADYLRMAHDSVRAAGHLLAAKDYPGFIISRAYYAMFYAATAVLQNAGQSYGKHSSVISAFGRDFAHAGKVPLHLHRYILDAFAQRSTGDYEPKAGLTETQAVAQITRATEFVAELEKFLNQQP